MIEINKKESNKAIHENSSPEFDVQIEVQEVNQRADKSKKKKKKKKKVSIIKKEEIKLI